MSDSSYEPSLEEQVSRFTNGPGIVVVARFFYDGKWWIGVCKGTEFNGSLCLLHIKPFIQYVIDPTYVGNFLPSGYKTVGDVQLDALPFRLNDPQKVIVPDNPPSTMVITDEEGKIVVLSQRSEDIVLTKQLLGSET